jgi:hypothetical protein
MHDLCLRVFGLGHQRLQRTQQSGWFPADRVRPVADDKLPDIKEQFKKLAEKKAQGW